MLVRLVNPSVAIVGHIGERHFRARAVMISPHLVTFAIVLFRRGSVHPRRFECGIVRLLAFRHQTSAFKQSFLSIFSSSPAVPLFSSYVHNENAMRG